VYREYGGPEVVHLEEVPTPVPKDDERRLLAVAGPLSTIVGAPLVSALGSKNVIAGTAPQSRVVAERLAGLATEGVLRPFIDECYEFF
jgi:hypothetical protein